MVTIEINGWRPGLEKISHTKLLQKYAGMGLRDARDSTHAMMDGTLLRFEASDQAAAESILVEFAAIGANARILPSTELAP